MHITMLIMCAARMDYCSGIGRFGWGNKVLIAYIEEHAIHNLHTDPPWLILSTELFDQDDKQHSSRSLSFDPRAFVMLLKRITYGAALSTSTYGSELPPGKTFRRAIKSDSVYELNTVVHDMLYCLRYWAGFDAARDRAGPVLPNYDICLFPDFVDTITELVTSDTDNLDFDIHSLSETHPVQQGPDGRV